MFKVDAEAFYNLSELSAGLNITIAGLRTWIRQGKLKATKIGRNYIIHGTDLLAFLQTGDQSKAETSATN
jgi:excisionase family DNA binding protein